MNIILISNFYNHHQNEISAELDKRTLHNFCFVETAVMNQERKQLGWSQNEKPEYVTSDCSKLCCADVAILGATPEKIAREAICRHIPTFRYSERPLKHGLEPLKYLPRWLRWHYRNPHGEPIYLLCASAYASGDYAKFGLFRNRAYKWGYFPETRHYSDIDALIQQKSRKRILWCGRFLDWKHPDDAIRVARMLKEDGLDFCMDFIGLGSTEESMHDLIAELDLESQVHILGSMSPKKVRDHMEASGIYLFTSDFQEGWGAVLNEAMNSGCAVVASHAIGAVPYLLKNEGNGLIYRSGDVASLYRKVRHLLMNPDEQLRLGKAAYHTIVNEWNAATAAERFVKLAEMVLTGEKSPNVYDSGPCSRAEILREDWFSE